MAEQIMTDKSVIHHEISHPDKDGNVTHYVTFRVHAPLKYLLGSRFQSELAAKLEKARKYHDGESHD